jgi:hypothetical protein
MSIKSSVVTVMAAILLMAAGPGPLTVGAEMTVIQHDDIFGKRKRPPVAFDHDLHMAALEENGCGACHHSWDDAAGQLVYMEGEELNCIECHLAEKEDGIPALREAYHGNCTACHRKRIKTKQLPAGPTTCGECHKAARP